MPSLNHRIEDILEYLIGVFVTSCDTNTEMRSVHTSLNSSLESVTSRTNHTLVLLVNLRCQVLGHKRSMSRSQERVVRTKLEGRSWTSDHRHRLVARINHRSDECFGQVTGYFFDRSSTFHCLLHLNQSSHTINHCLYQLNLRLADSSFVRDIIPSANSTRVFTSRTSSLKTESSTHFLQLVRIGTEVLKLHKHTGSKTSTEVRRTSANETEVLVMHELMTQVFQAHLDGSHTSNPSIEHLNDVSSFLHRDHSHVVFLVYPDQEALLVVMEDTSGIGPVSSSTSVIKKSASTWFLEQEVVLSHLFFFLWGHLT